jgi:hypothetical protein
MAQCLSRRQQRRQPPHGPSVMPVNYGTVINIRHGLKIQGNMP